MKVLSRIEFKCELPFYYRYFSSGQDGSGTLRNWRGDGVSVQQPVLGCCEDAPEESFGNGSQPDAQGIWL